MLFRSHGHGIYPMDAVLRVIEVKSSLDKAGLAQLKQLAQMLNPGNPDGLKIAAKGTLENGHAYYPFSSLFAYKTTLKDISKTMKLIGGFDGLTVPICVAKQSTDDPSSDSLENKLRRFLTFLLNEIEISADSRKPFSVVEWLSNDR